MPTPDLFLPLPPHPHDDACAGLRRAVAHLCKGRREIAALEVLASAQAAARGAERGEITVSAEAQIQRAAREILLACIEGLDV